MIPSHMYNESVFSNSNTISPMGRQGFTVHDNEDIEIREHMEINVICNNVCL